MNIKFNNFFYFGFVQIENFVLDENESLFEIDFIICTAFRNEHV